MHGMNDNYLLQVYLYCGCYMVCMCVCSCVIDLLSSLVDTDTSSTTVTLMYRSTHWSAISWYWQRVKQGIQQCWLSLLLHAVPHVQCTDAYCTHMYAAHFHVLLTVVFSYVFIIVSDFFCCYGYCQLACLCF